jgi:hypothetical protein
MGEVEKEGERACECAHQIIAHRIPFVPLFTAILLAGFPSPLSTVASGRGSIKICISWAEQSLDRAPVRLRSGF